MRSLILLLGAGASCMAADLTGNWVVAQDMRDGTFRKTYLNVKQEGGKITGSIRATQFFYKVVESTGGPETFTLTGSPSPGPNTCAGYEGSHGHEAKDVAIGGREASFRVPPHG